MTLPRRIYLDNAATSWPKPDEVYAAMDEYHRQVGAPAGRSGYREAMMVERVVAETRMLLARLIGAQDPRQIIFTYSGTDALNLAIHGLLRPGDHAITSDVDHNSVLRPLRQLETSGEVEVTRVGCDADGMIDPDDIHRALKPETKLVALTHASNVTGTIQPLEQVGAIVQQHPALLLVDAAQTLGHVPLDVRQLNADLLAAPGHKGLMGPLGTGLLYVAPGIETQLATVRQGGTGTRSDQDRQPESLPDKYECGNHNVPGIFGLKASLLYLREHGIAAIGQRSMQRTAELLDGLSRIPGVQIHGHKEAAHRVPVVSIELDRYDPQELAAVLDASHQIQVRAGLHCAPRMHAALGTARRGGTVRLSPGPLTSEEDVQTTLGAISELAAVRISA